VETCAVIRRLVVATFTLLVASISNCPSYAQSGPFTGMAGNWSGGGTVTLDDGSTEKIRCRATYAVGAGGNGLNQRLLCASDSYKFDLAAMSSPRADRFPAPGAKAAVASAEPFRDAAAAAIFRLSRARPEFNANISLTTRGNKQSVVIRAESQFRGASIALSRR